MLNKTTIFFIFLFYLVIVFFVLSALPPDMVSADATKQNLGIKINFLGLTWDLGSTFLGNIITNVNNIPIAINIIFIVIPSVMVVVFGIAQFIPTEPS